MIFYELLTYLVTTFSSYTLGKTIIWFTVENQNNPGVDWTLSNKTLSVECVEKVGEGDNTCIVYVIFVTK